MEDPSRVVRASRLIRAEPEVIFELIADPSQQPRWDGNGNLAAAEEGQRVRGVGDVFRMMLTESLTPQRLRENTVVEFEEGRRIAWLPAEPGDAPPGHLWRWEVEPAGQQGYARVTHTYDWSRLDDEMRMARARSTTAAMLSASLDRLAELAENSTH